MTQWDFTADVSRLLEQTQHGDGPRSMTQMVEAVDALCPVGHAPGEELQSWLAENARDLIGQQVLVASVHAQSLPLDELPRVLHDWATSAEHPTATAAVVWLKEEYPGLLRAWLLSRVEGLVGAELQQALGHARVHTNGSPRALP